MVLCLILLMVDGYCDDIELCGLFDGLCVFLDVLE